MGKTVAGKLLEQFDKLHGKKVNENEEPIGKDKDGKPLGVDGKVDAPNGESQEDIDKKSKVAEDGSMNDLGEVPNQIAKIKEAFSGDEKKSADAMDSMKKLSESKHPMAKKFMEAVDDMTSAIDMKKMDKDGKEVNEDADGEYLSVFEPKKWAHLSEKYGKKADVVVKK